MMKFEKPEIEVIKFAVEDIITTSNTDPEIGGGGEWETPLG